MRASEARLAMARAAPEAPDPAQHFLPDALARIEGFAFLSRAERRLVSQVQARTYAAMFRLLAAVTGAPQRAPFAPLEALMAQCMPAGYRFVADPASEAGVLRARSRWSLLALSCLAGLAAQAHYRQTLEPGTPLDAAWREHLRRHWQASSQRAEDDEQRWREEDRVLDREARERAVGEFIFAVGRLDRMLQAQAAADAAYFRSVCGRAVAAEELARIEASLLHAYRWQVLLSGVQMPHFAGLLGDMLDGAQFGWVASALAPLFDASREPRIGALRAAGPSGPGSGG